MWMEWNPNQRMRVDAASCTWTDPISGDFFDLSSLNQPKGQSWIANDGDVLYSTNVCGIVTQPCTDSKVEAPAVSLQFAAGRCMAKLGVFANPEYSVLPVDGLSPRGGVSVKYNGGDMCAITRQPRQVIIHVHCDPSASSVQPLKASEGTGPAGICTYDINLASKHGCPTRNGISFGWILLIVTFVVLGLLLGSLIVWNIAKNKKSGFEALPDMSFMVELGRLSVVGCKFTGEKLVVAVGALVAKIKEDRERAKYKVMESGDGTGDV